MELKECFICKKKFEGKQTKIKFLCSDICRKISRYNNKGINYYDFPKCEICGERFKGLDQHLRQHHELDKSGIEKYLMKNNITKEDLIYKDKKYKKICIICGNEYYNQIPSSKTCSNKMCKEKQYFNSIKSNVSADYDSLLECKICNKRTSKLANHIKYHHKDISVDSYCKKYNLTKKDLIHNKLVEYMSERIKGDKNPLYQHNGKFSSYSKNFIKYDKLSEDEKEKEINKIVNKMKKTKLDNELYPQRIEYWIKQGYTEKEAKEKVSERQTTFSKEKCIIEYGEIEGLKIFNERQRKWQETLNNKSDEEKAEINLKKNPFNHLNFTNRYGEIDGMIKYNEFRLNNSKTYSKISIEMFDEIIKQGSLDLSDVEYKENETISYDETNNKYYLYDFTLYSKKKIIEFNGDYWHASPKKYRNNEVIKQMNREISVDEIWKQDYIKVNHAISKGYEVLIIWESDYKNNKKKIINKCLEFLNV